MIEVTLQDAARIASEKKRGELFCHCGEPRPVIEIDFQGNPDPEVSPLVVGDEIKVVWIVETESGGLDHRITTIGIPLADLRSWCAEHYGCSEEEVVLWFEN